MTVQEQISLTNLSVAGGCGCKLDPASLEKILCSFKSHLNKDLIIGFETDDDCAVYEYSKEDYLLFTTDFFTPLVDDPYIFGALAAANAVSDIFAMGGKPLIANAILGFPTEKVPLETVQKIMQGGQETLQRQGCMVVGGHTIVNPQPIFGFSIIGRVEKENLKPNSGAKEGDLLLLTKPIGSGILSNALKLGLLDDECYQSLLPYLLEVNSSGLLLSQIKGVHAMTDLTGFGLAGHCLEMCEGANLCLEIEYKNIKLFQGTKELCEAVISPNSGAVRNFKNYNKKTHFNGHWTENEKHIICDPQSNGGLLIAIDPNSLEEVQNILIKACSRQGSLIGVFKEKNETGYPLTINK